jgi:hypothetical protein
MNYSDLYDYLLEYAIFPNPHSVRSSVNRTRIVSFDVARNTQATGLYPFRIVRI